MVWLGGMNAGQPVPTMLLGLVCYDTEAALELYVVMVHSLGASPR